MAGLRPFLKRICDYWLLIVMTGSAVLPQFRLQPAIVLTKLLGNQRLHVYQLPHLFIIASLCAILAKIFPENV
jgi:hypothetical protein